MDHWHLHDSLPFIAAVVDLFLLRQVTVAAAFPVLSPALHPVAPVPACSLHHAALPLFPIPRIHLLKAGRRIEDRNPVPGFVQQEPFLLFHSPASILFDRPHGGQRLAVRIAVPFVMDCDINAHAFFHERRKKIVEHLNLCLTVCLNRQRHFEFPGELGV